MVKLNKSNRKIKKILALKKHNFWWNRPNLMKEGITLHSIRNEKGYGTFSWEKNSPTTNYFMFMNSVAVIFFRWFEQFPFAYLLVFLLIQIPFFWCFFSLHELLPYYGTLSGEYELGDTFWAIFRNLSLFFPGVQPEKIAWIDLGITKYLFITEVYKFPICLWEPFFSCDWTNIRDLFADKPLLFTVAANAYCLAQYLDSSSNNLDIIILICLILMMIYSGLYCRIYYFFISFIRDDEAVEFLEWFKYEVSTWFFSAPEDRFLFLTGFDMDKVYSPRLYFSMIGDEEDPLEEDFWDYIFEKNYSRKRLWDLWPWTDERRGDWQDIDEEMIDEYNPDDRFLNEESDFWDEQEEGDFLYPIERYFFPNLNTPWLLNRRSKSYPGWIKECDKQEEEDEEFLEIEDEDEDVEWGDDEEGEEWEEELPMKANLLYETVLFNCDEEYDVDDTITDPTYEQAVRKIQTKLWQNEPLWNKFYITLSWLAEYWGLNWYNIPSSNLVDTEEEWGGSALGDNYSEFYLRKKFHKKFLRYWGYGVDEFEYYSTPVKYHQQNELVLQVQELLLLAGNALLLATVVFTALLFDAFYSSQTLQYISYWYIYI